MEISVAAEKCSNRTREVWAALLASRRIGVFCAFMVISTATDAIVVVGGFGATSHQSRCHRRGDRLVHCRGK